MSPVSSRFFSAQKKSRTISTAITKLRFIPLLKCGEENPCLHFYYIVTFCFILLTGLNNTY